MEKNNFFKETPKSVRGGPRTRGGVRTRGGPGRGVGMELSRRSGQMNLFEDQAPVTVESTTSMMTLSTAPANLPRDRPDSAPPRACFTEQSNLRAHKSFEKIVDPTAKPIVCIPSRPQTAAGPPPVVDLDFPAPGPSSGRRGTPRVYRGKVPYKRPSTADPGSQDPKKE